MSLRAEPFAAPDQQRIAALGLGRRELGAAAAARVILLLPGDIALLPSAPDLAAERLRELAQPFTLSAARQALGTTRRVAVPLLEHLDRIGVTERVDGDLRRLRVPVAVGA
jgi:selenocysteine-specific elongation factor